MMTEVGNVADWKVFAVRDSGERVLVAHLFIDISITEGKLQLTETHDFTQATHVETEAGEVVALSDGAQLVAELLY